MTVQTDVDADVATEWPVGADRFVVRPRRPARMSAPSAAARAFHVTLPGYQVSRLVEVSTLARRWQVGSVVVKDESCRFGLPAFKALGASWAVARLVGDRGGLALDELRLDRLRAVVRQDPPILVTATDGNHGRALVRIGSWLGAPVEVVVPQVMDDRVEQAIAGEGARVTRVAGDYDQAVAAAAQLADRLPGGVLVQDTAWPGYEVVPGWIVEGYQTLLDELDEQLAARGQTADLVAVPVGVGSLAQAVVHWARGSVPGRARVLSCEPDTAACVLASLAADTLLSVPTSDTVMAGLNCGTPSSLAWPLLRDGLDAAVAVDDAAAAGAVRTLAAAGVPSGASGAATLAGADAVLTDPRRRAALDLPEDAVVVLLNTEGPAGAGGTE